MNLFPYVSVLFIAHKKLFLDLDLKDLPSELAKCAR